MTSYTRLIPPRLPIGGAAAAGAFASLMVERLRKKAIRRQKAALDKTAVNDWEDEGGSMAATNVTAPEPSPINLETGARGGRCGNVDLAPAIS
jgi:hypothetical protein